MPGSQLLLTGGGDGSTVGHGLTGSNLFSLSTSGCWWYLQNWNAITLLLALLMLVLNLVNEFVPDDFLNNQTPLNTVIEFGTSNSVSAVGTDYIAYAGSPPTAPLVHTRVMVTLTTTVYLYRPILDQLLSCIGAQILRVIGLCMTQPETQQTQPISA